MRLTSSPGYRWLTILVAGDILVLLIWVMVGLASHRLSADWLVNLVRIAAPFLIGWFAVAPWTGAYDQRLFARTGAFLGRSVLTWAAAVALGLLLRATLFGSGFVPTFAAVTVGTTALFMLGWRAVFGLVARGAR